MPSSSSLTTSSGALISFFTVARLLSLARPGQVEDHRSQDPADDRADHRDPRVPPIGIALAGDGQEGVGDAGPEVTGGVDGVPGGTSEGEADGQDQQADQKRGEAGAGSALVIPEGQDADEQHGGAD